MKFFQSKEHICYISLFLVIWFPLIFSKGFFTYYKRFAKDEFPHYDLYSPSNDLCDPNVDCTYSLTAYNGWSSNQTDYVMGSDIIDTSWGLQTFGGKVFGRWDLIQKTFFNLPTHSMISVSLSVHYGRFTTKDFYFKCDDFEIVQGSDQGTIIFLAYLNHTSSNLTIQIQSHSNDMPSLYSYGISDFEVSLSNECPPGCILCNGTTCTKCFFFANLVNSTCSCLPGYFMIDDFSSCRRCDISCKSCSGILNNQCISCYTGDTFNSVSHTCDSPSSDLKIKIFKANFK